MTNLGRVAIYVRCSTSEQSTDMQKTAIADYLAKRLRVHQNLRRCGTLRDVDYTTWDDSVDEGHTG